MLIGVFVYLYKTTSIPDPNKDFQTQSSFVYYADGKTEIGQYATQNRQIIPLGDMPQRLQNAVVAAEDRTFWTNHGIDPKGIIRAAFNDARGGATQGASTITQQYVKILYLTQERSPAPQGARGDPVAEAPEAAEQAGDPRGLPQHHLLRPWGLRRPGRGPGVLRRRRQGAHVAAERGARRGPEQPVAVRPGQRQGQQGGAARPLPLRPGRDGVDGNDPGGQGHQGGETPAEVPGVQGVQTSTAARGATC